MLQQFSWTTFLVFFASVSALWYLTLLLTVFRKDAIAFLSGAASKSPIVSVSDTTSCEKQPDSPEQEIMGKSRMPDGLEGVSMAALSFSASGDSAFENDHNQSDQLGLVPDVLQEIKEIFGVLAKEDGDKQDFFSLAAMISEKYGRIGSSPNIGKINEYIRDHAPFAITLEELENLWD